MQNLDGQLVLSPTDLTKHLACRHVTSLDLEAVRGNRAKPVVDDDELQLIFAKGLAHERDYLDYLKSQGQSIVEIPTKFDADSRREAERLTVDAMKSGADVVYQATFFDGMWGGQADFLLRVERPSNLGDWSYEVADTKLARRLKVPALLQMSIYADRLSLLQGVEPSRIYVVTGDKRTHDWRLVDVSSYTHRARARLRNFVDRPSGTEPVQVQHCGQCRWISVCAAQWRATDDLHLVAFMRNDHRELLRQHGIATLAQLGTSTPDSLPPQIGRASRERMVEQATEQLKERASGAPSYLLLPPEQLVGLQRLPAPDPGDLYLDFEGDPFAEDGTGREYLAGLGDRDGGFHPLWAHSLEAERQLTANLVDRLLGQWQQHPGMHVYHYAPYEVTALKRLTSRHGVRESELDQLLRGERFVDLYAVVRQGMRISKSSYSIKKMEAFYWAGERNQNEDVADALSSVIAYERWIVERDDSILRDIEDYNRDDVRSTHDLHAWLEERRDELAELHGPLTRPEDVPLPEEVISDEERRELELAANLQDAGHQLVADLVQWHRREARPSWWEFFRPSTLLEEEYEYDSSVLGPLSDPEFVDKVKRSQVWKYTFPPQETRIRAGQAVYDAKDQASGGSVVELDAAAGFVLVKKMGDPLRARGFGPQGPVRTDSLRESIAASGQSWLAGSPHPLVSSLLECHVPHGLPARADEKAQDAVVRVGRELRDSVLAVQGPPGSGKTRTGGELIRQLLDDGKRVGITAPSHAVIGNLLRAVGRSGVQKCNEDEHCGVDVIVAADSNPDVRAMLDSGAVSLAAGTAWLWAHESMHDAVDVLVVDEAGQFSLANAVAIAPSASSMVLLGDPQQLAQPSQAQHPEGAEVSALQHVLGEHDTIPPDRGIFLDLTYRMHPDITAFVSEMSYDGRLESAPERDRHEILGDGELSGSGLRFVTVAHTANAARSTEEAERVEQLWNGLVGGTFVGHDGNRTALTAADVMVVAPFNSQVGEIQRRLPADARVGTVDKFQGQQAPVVIYSMTSSSADDAPRGVEFLYDLHRFNVALSRAKALAVVVCSETLLDAPVNSPEQLRRVNALCRFAEQAEPAR